MGLSLQNFRVKIDVVTNVWFVVDQEVVFKERNPKLNVVMRTQGNPSCTLSSTPARGPQSSISAGETG